MAQATPSSRAREGARLMSLPTVGAVNEPAGFEDPRPRADHAQRISGNQAIRYAEAVQRMLPRVAEAL